MLSLAGKILLKKYGAIEGDKSKPIHTGFASISQFSDLSETTRQSSAKLEVHTKSYELSPHQMAGADGHPSHEDEGLIDRVLARRYSILGSTVFANQLSQKKTDGRTSSDGCKERVQNEPDGFSNKSAGA